MCQLGLCLVPILTILSPMPIHSPWAEIERGMKSPDSPFGDQTFLRDPPNAPLNITFHRVRPNHRLLVF
jgi:hypothetical protein